MASPTHYTNEQIAEQQKTCYQMRLRHESFRAIAAATGLSVSTVFERVETEIAETVAPYREQYQVMQRERLDGLSRTVMDMLAERHYTISDGRVVQLDGEPIEDAEFVLKCIDRLMKIEDRRAKLLGLDAPVKVDATVTETTQQDLELIDMVNTARAAASAAEAELKESADD